MSISEESLKNVKNFIHLEVQRLFNDQVIGYLGAVHPKLASERDLEDTCILRSY